MISEFNSDLSGKRVNLPVNLLVSTSTKAGVATLFSKASLITAKFNDLSLTSITFPIFKLYGGISVLTPFTKKWPWFTNCLACLLVEAKPNL